MLTSKNQKTAPAAAALPETGDVEKEDGGDKKSQEGQHSNRVADLTKDSRTQGKLPAVCANCFYLLV